MFTPEIKNLSGKELESFISNFKIEGFFAPITYTSHIDGQKFAICIGNPWIPIPDLMTEKDVQKSWVKKEHSLPSFVKKITGPRGGNYTVTFDDKTWKCTCSTYLSKRKCDHINVTKFELKAKL